VRQVCGQLASELSRVVGPSGYQALLARSLKLTRAQHPCLHRLHPILNNEDPLPRWMEVLETQEMESILEVGAAVITRMVTLLFTFIGEALTLQLLASIWSGFALPETSEKL
jgi:hypothetical protein